MPVYCVIFLTVYQPIIIDNNLLVQVICCVVSCKLTIHCQLEGLYYFIKPLFSLIPKGFVGLSLIGL